MQRFHHFTTAPITLRPRTLLSINTAKSNHGRQENGDDAGRVTGSYTTQLADGRTLVVEYSTDEIGYRAIVKMKEFGIESKNPADAAFLSSDIPSREAVLRVERGLPLQQYRPAPYA